MLIAEELVLLLVDNETGKPTTDHTTLAEAVGGAVLAELAIAGRIDVAGPGDDVETGRLVVRDTTPLDQPVLDKVLERASRVKVGKLPETVLGRLASGLWPDLLAGLAERGILRREERRILYIFRTESWPTKDAHHEMNLRRRLDEVLNHGAEPTDRERALLGLLAATGTVRAVMRCDQAAKARAEELGRGVWAVEAVRKAMVEVTGSAFRASTTPHVGGA